MLSRFRNRKLHLESLENRQLLAAYINEIHFDPLFGSQVEDQYVELKGEPNSTIDAGTYFVAVHSDDGVVELGDVHTIIDLGGKQFGSNGLMVFLPSGNGYSVDTAATAFTGNDGFQGIDGFDSDDDRPEIRGSNNSFLIIQSDIPPSLTDDIDGDNDGLPEGAYLNWTIIDGVAVFRRTVFTRHAYAPILFTENDEGNSRRGTVRVPTEELSYVGRIGDSVDYDPDNWVAGRTVETESDPGNYQFQLQRGIFGTVRPPAFSGRILDHVGQPNWYSDVSGYVFQDRNIDGVKDNGEIGLPDVAVGIKDINSLSATSHVEEVNPDDYESGDVVVNTSSNVTLTIAGDSNAHHSFDVTVVDKEFQNPAAGQMFAHAGVGFFNEGRRLRMDFYRPAKSVTARFIGNSLSATYGRLEIFDKEGQSIRFVRTQPLARGVSQTLSLTSDAEDIAYAVAYSNESYLNSSPFGQIDYLSFAMSDRSATTDANGRYHFDNVPIGTYDVRSDLPSGYRFELPATGTRRLEVNDEKDYHTEHFSLSGGLPPEFNNSSHTVSESASEGAQVGLLDMTLGYPHQELDVAILSGNEDNKFAIDWETRKITLDSTVNFETRTQYDLVVKLTDRFDSDLSSQATVTINVLDANDPPQINDFSAALDENPPLGHTLGTLTGSDEDVGDSFVFSLVDESSDAVELSPEGVLTVGNPAAFNFEVNPNVEIQVQATDPDDANVFSRKFINFRLNDINEPPVISTETVRVAESIAAGGLVGFIEFDDPDAGQTLSWSVVSQDTDLFRVVAGGNLMLLEDQRLNYEQADSHQVVIRVADSGTPSLSSEKTITVDVSDANDAPVFQTQTVEIPEDAIPGADLASLIASDEDAGQTLHYKMVSGPEELLEIADDGTVRLKPEQQLDFETTAQYIVIAEVVDSSLPPASAQATVTVSVADANDAPVLVSTDLSVAENTAAGSVAATVEFSDQDATDAHTFAIVEQSQPWFDINADGQLVVLDGADIDFESTASSTVTVKVTDSAGAEDSHQYTVLVEDQNDPPRLTGEIPNQSASVGEAFYYTIPAGTFVDDDAGDSLRFTLVDGQGFPLPSWLSFDADTLTLSGTPTADYAGSLLVRLDAVDQARAFASTTFKIEIEDDRFPWHNASNGLDVNQDRAVAPIDVLMIINYLNGGNPNEIPVGAPPNRGHLDVNADNFVSPIDALIIINHLNAQASGEGEGEGEGPTDSSTPRDFYFEQYGFETNHDDEEENNELLRVLLESSISRDTTT